MPRKFPSRSIRVEEELAKKAEAHAARLNLSLNKFCEISVQVICDMVEHPETRVVPALVQMLDAIDQSRPTLEK